ncbi:MAG: D-glycero-beta-D-manno-heptose 1-phosphate adenylyltransferase [Desulfobacteraceae bacterium]
MTVKKIVTRDRIAAAADESRAKQKTIAFTNGCFDILHAGHVKYLARAAEQGDLLILGLNSDASVRRIKGEKRPIIHQTHRAEVVSALACVDYVVLFDEPDPGNLIRAIKPDILVKGADWAENDIIGADVVKENGGRVSRIELEPGISTTAIVEKIVKTFAQ